MAEDIIIQKLYNIEKLLESQTLLPKEVLNFNEACQYLNISQSHLNKLTSTNHISYFCPQEKRLYFKRTDLADWLQRNRKMFDTQKLLDAHYQNFNQQNFNTMTPDTNTYIDTFRMNEAAKTLDLGFGRNTLFSMLRDKNILDHENTPYQRYVDKGYFKLIIKPRPCQRHRYDKVTLVTYKGIDFLRKVLDNETSTTSTTTQNILGGMAKENRR